MKRKLIFTTALLCVTLCVPLALFGQSRDFEMNGTVLVKLWGSQTSFQFSESQIIVIILYLDPLFFGVVILFNLIPKRGY